MNRGVFISFEGAEGSGKSTQLALAARRLTAEGYPVVTAREPGGTPAGEAIRSILQHDAAGSDVCPVAETLLFEASRAQLVERVIRPALASGAVVLCDRFADSTTAYQGYGRGFAIETLEFLHAFAVSGTWPDRTLLLDVSVEVGLARLRARNARRGVSADRMEREPDAFHGRVAEGYRALARRWPERFRVVDASGSEAAVHEALWPLIKELLP